MKPVLQKQKTKKDLDLQKILQVPVFFFNFRYKQTVLKGNEVFILKMLMSFFNKELTGQWSLKDNFSEGSFLKFLYVILIFITSLSPKLRAIS